jgi:putative hemolysin
MKSKTTSKLSILLNIVLILFFIVYFCVPFSVTGFWSKAFSPLCTIISAFQGPDFLPGWCLIQQSADNSNMNSNVNTNNNININENVNAGLANPASVKCVTDGGQSEIYQTADGGQGGLCVFSDQSICEEWTYYRGECKMGQCQKVCKAINTESEGWYNSCTGDLIKAEVCSAATDVNANVNADIANSNTNSNANTNVNADIANPEPAVNTSANITVSSPTSDEQLISPITVSGRAKTSDNKIYVRVKSKSGSTVISVNGTVKNVGADGYGDFKLTINYEFSTTKEGFIDVFSKDGDTEVNLVSIPVKF